MNLLILDTESKKMDTKEHAELVKHNQEHFDEQAKKWDDDEEYVSVSKESYATLMKHIGQHINHEHTRVLNFGCGTGHRIDGSSIVGRCETNCRSRCL